ncbi:MAG: class I SAM-dependent methyltransferase [Solirubrobacteraceae bacterium]|nr:class I SAM-dependent methyltransferase [Solirubrobacteraceae bacterium]
MASSLACPYNPAHSVAPGVVEATERMLGLGGTYRYASCATCGALWLTDVPADLAPFYAGDDYYSFEAAADPGEQRLLALAMKPLLRSRRLALAGGMSRWRGKVFPFAATWFAGQGITQSSRILDVGSGSGTTLARLRWLGFRDLSGIDPFLPSPEIRIGPVTIRRQALESVEEQYDVVLFNHSLEHVPDPVGALRAASARLRPGGRVVVGVPLADSAAFERYGTRWAQLDAPRHLTVPTAAALDAAAAAAGLRVVSAYRDSHAFQFWGSEQYAHDITLHGPRSWLTDPAASPFTPAQIEAWEAEARALNRAGRGDQGVFVFAAA